MYIPYEKIGNLLFRYIPNDNLKSFFYNAKIRQNVNFIKHNEIKVLKNLHQKFIHNEKLKVVFCIYDEAKWKCRNLYDLLSNDSRFDVKILVTRNSVTDVKNPSFQDIQEIQNTYNELKKQGMNVELAYDCINQKHIPFAQFAPDIIIYQHPWYIETSQGPVVCSKFAITAYVPYFVVNAGLKEDYYLRFHQYVERHYVLSEELVKFFSSKMSNHGVNLFAVGHPQLDFYYLNKEKIKSDSNEYCVIYAPHWSICKKNIGYGTFEWNGEFILEFAQKHPEIHWVFKPHPMLFKSIIDNKIMTPYETQEYYAAWDKIGQKYEGSNYLELFCKSDAMITDCGSFLTEYFITKKPVLHILSGVEHNFCTHYKKVTQNYYKIHNIDELEKYMEQIFVKKDDILKEIREKNVEEYNFYDTYSSKNIINNLTESIS